MVVPVAMSVAVEMDELVVVTVVDVAVDAAVAVAWQ